MGRTLQELLDACNLLNLADLRSLRDWQNKQAHLPQLSDVQLVPFLYSNRFSVHRTHGCLQAYWRLRSQEACVFRSRDPHRDDWQQQFKVVYLAACPRRDQAGHTVVVTKLAVTQPEVYDFDICCSILTALLEVLVVDDPISPGFVFVLDMMGMTMGHVLAARIGTIKAMLTYVQEAMPLRMKAVHVINSNAVLDAIMAILKPFMHDDLKALLHFHSGDLNDLYKEVTRDVLPEEFGGHGGSIADMTKDTKQLLTESRDWLLAWDSLHIEESFREGDNDGDIYSVQGSFKKLDID